MENYTGEFIAVVETKDAAAIYQQIKNDLGGNMTLKISLSW